MELDPGQYAHSGYFCVRRHPRWIVGRAELVHVYPETAGFGENQGGCAAGLVRCIPSTGGFQDASFFGRLQCTIGFGSVFSEKCNAVELGPIELTRAVHALFPAVPFDFISSKMDQIQPISFTASV